MEGFASHLGRRLISSTEIQAGLDDSTVSYLVNSCGLSPEAAIVASHKFLCSIGLSRLDLARTLANNPIVLMRSLEYQIRPSYTFFKKVVLSDVKVVDIWKRNSWIFRGNLFKNVIPNIELVRELGMPQSCIALLLTYYANIVMKKPDFFSQLVGEVKEMGFDPQRSSFVQAMHALSGKETTWKLCQEAYMRWGWSDEDILDASRSHPLCMMKSGKKIMETMDFLVNKMGWQSQKIARSSRVLGYSLEKRIIPRCSVVRILLLKGLLKEEELNMNTITTTSEKYFLTKFVSRYLNQVPQLLNVYQGKVDFQDV